MLDKIRCTSSIAVLSAFLATIPVFANSTDYFNAHGDRSERLQTYQGRVAYVPAGMTLTVYLENSISTAVAQEGEPLQAILRDSVDLGGTCIPAGSHVIGKITVSEAGRRLGRSGELGMKFYSLKTPDGREYPLSSHLVGKISGYGSQPEGSDDVVKGEGMGNKIGSVAFRGAIGAGGGALLGTAVGAIAGGGRGAGRGAWSGTAIGTGVGVADSLLLRKGNDVKIKSGTPLRLQIDTPFSIAWY
ncbi:unnamed protein product [Sphagnum jensenii]